MNHKKRPADKITYIISERSFVSLVFSVFATCGKYEIVVNAAARKPIMVVQWGRIG